MGREASVHKLRKCKLCENKIYLTAKELREHERICKIAKETGLILPGVGLYSGTE